MNAISVIARAGAPAAVVALAVGVLAQALPAAAADEAGRYPERPIRLLVGFAPGGGTDTTARAIAQKLGQALGQQVIVDNRPGAAGNIATQIVANANPDGYTLLMGTIAALAINPTLFGNLPFDPVRDFAPITQAVNSTNVLFQVGDAYSLAGTTRSFDAAFAGFWFSHVPLERQREFLAGLNAALAPGARVVLLDNLFVQGSSSAIAEQDGIGNTYQYRKLDDGSTHRVLKNFPTEAQLNALMAEGLGEVPAYRRWQYYWAFEYRVPEP